MQRLIQSGCALHAFSVALVEEFAFLIAVVIQVLEVAQDSAGGGEHGEGAGILLHNGAQCRNLGVVDHAQQDAGLMAGIHTLGRHQGGTVVQVLNDVIGDFFGIIRDDLTVNGTAERFDDPVGDGAGHEGVENAENDRFQLIVIDEVAAEGNDNVDGEADPEKAHFGVRTVNQSRHKVHTAGGGAAPHQKRIGGTVDNTGNQRTEDLAGAVGRLIIEVGQVELIQEQQTQREGHHIDHTAAGHGTTDLPQNDQSQRDVDEQTQIADADAGYILNHGADAVETGRCKVVRKDKQLIVEGTEHR